MGLFLEAATATTKPFIYLSAGVSNAEFTEALELAAESGVKFNGVLCGRTPGRKACLSAQSGAAAQHALEYRSRFGRQCQGSVNSGLDTPAVR